jgi:signal transduction histidine kinase
MPGTGHAGPKQLRRLLNAIATVGSDLDLDVILRRVVEAAVEMVDASYGALGVLNPERTHLSDFITVGIDRAGAAAIGELPKGHGILGVLIHEPRPLRLPDLREHPDSFGFPPDHPSMTSFLGVPVYVGGQAYGNLYLTDKAHDEVFTDVDEEMAIALAAAAGTAIEKAWLHARVRELDVLADRERIARDLHDTVIQRLFATGLSLQSAVRLAAPLPDVVDRIQQAVDELDEVVRQIRSSIFELHAAEVAPMGLRRQLLAVGDDLSDALGFSPTFRFDGPIEAAVSRELADHVLAVVREALSNVARHAESSGAAVLVEADPDRVTVIVEDEGVGPGPTRAGGYGLENLTSRAEELGGGFSLAPGPSRGTRMCWWAPIPR